MDSNIRQLLAAAQQYGVESEGSFLHQAYDQLRVAAETKPTSDGPLPFGQDLYVLCAEIAFQYGLDEITKECLKMFFMKASPSNQFLCRAYLCQAQLLAPTSAEHNTQLEKAVVYLLKAINFAKENQRYHFLVYNASVLFWQFCRPFLKPGYRQYLSISLHSVVKALDDIDDKDYEWRAQLMIALIECHVDAGRIKEAAEVSKATAEFTKAFVPLLYKQVLGLQIRHQLVDHNKLVKDIRQNGDLTVYYKLVKLRVSLEQKEVTDLDVQGDRILRQILMEEEVSRSSSSLSGRNKTATPISAVSDDVRSSRGSHKRAPAAVTAAAAASPTTPAAVTNSMQYDALASSAQSVSTVAPLLLELANLCVEYDMPELVTRCLEGLKNSHIKEKGTFIQMEFIECSLMVLNLRERQESYSKSSVEVRIKAISRLSEAIMNAIRYGDPNIIQAGCVAQWNLCLPLLQTNLREHARKPLTLVAEALENIQSLLVLLRCQIHTELAKIEEDEEQIQVAMEHLKKALGLDDGGQYHERLETALHRLQLRAELYKPPDSMEDQAAMIIEQARKSADSGTVRMKRSLLVKAGQALSPDAFLLVLESENELKDELSSSLKEWQEQQLNVTDRQHGGGGKGYMTIINQLGNKAKHFQKCVKKCSGHIKRLGSENERDRARLWADLAKVARKQEVWDVCRVAARFCLLYDDDRWNMVRPSTVRSDTHIESVPGVPEPADTPTKSRKAASEAPTQENHTVTHSDKDLIRTLAEIHFLNAEALVHLLRSEGVSLNNEPIPPKDKSKHPKGYVPTKPEDDPDWIVYRDWIKDLSASITKGFLRASELGVQLTEPWIVCSSTTYLWNYNNHLLSAGRHRELIDCFGSLLQDLKQVGHAGETVMLVNLCTALAFGLVQPWIPKSTTREVVPPSSPSPKGRGDKESPRKAKSVASHTSAKTRSLTVDPDGMEDIKKAMEVCDYGMEVTNGTRPLDVVPISVRHPLIINWALVKQLIGQQIPKSLGTEDENNTEGQRPLTRCLVALEMRALNGKGLTDFKETPPLVEICNMVEECEWGDSLVELQVWTRLSELALASRDHQLVLRATTKALAFNNNNKVRSKKMDDHKMIVWHEMLSYSSRLLGQTLMFNMEGKNAIRRSALDAFVNAARYGRKAKNFGLVITAARQYWNACLPLVNEPMERQLLKEPLTIILDSITATTEKIVKKEDGAVAVNGGPPGANKAKGESPIASPSTSSIADVLSDPEDDLTLRAALYGVMFQAFVDQGEWEEALAAMDKAVSDMPRTKHRLLIFKHRLMVKATLGRDINVDIAKFKDESENYLSVMWHKVALCSRDQREQLSAYKNAIEALQSSASDWQKVEYLMEFSEWLYVNEFPTLDCVDQLEWAADILLNMKIETRSKVTEQAAGKSKKKKGKKSAEPVSQSPALHSPTPTETKTMTEGATDSEGEDSMAARFIPVKKQSVIGLSASNLNLSASELTSIKQLEHLVRIHIMLAKTAGRDSPMHTSYCMLAWGFLIRIWQVSLSSAGQVAKEMAKVSISNEQLGSQKSSAKANKGKKDAGGKGGSKEMETPRDKPKRKGPLDAVPLHPEDWAMYDVPDEMREAFKEDHTGEGINRDSIAKPTLTLYYLDSLVTELRSIGYSHLTFPALVLGEVIARDIVESNVAGNTYRLLSAEICLELNLTSGVKFHEASAGALGVNEEDQAKCREDTSRYQERQNQVRREAGRAKELRRLMTAENKVKKKQSRNIIPADQKTDIIESVMGLSQPLSGMTFRQAWTQQAEILIKQGYNQAARELLNEAHLSTKAFDDKFTEASILKNLAKLSLQEANCGQAINLLKEAQRFDGDELFWLDTTLLLVEATLGDPEDWKRNNKARAVILKALSLFSTFVDKRPNKKGLLTYIKSTLEAKFATIQISQVLEESSDTMKPKAHRELQDACQRLKKSADDLIGANYTREAVQIMQQQASVLRLFACDSDEKDVQHDFLLQAQTIMLRAVGMMDHLLHDVCSLSAVQELRSISLPLQRESCNVKIAFAELLIDMFVIYAEEHRKRQITEARKGSVEKLVENFISAKPVLTDTEKQWRMMASTFATGALSLLQSAHSLAGSITHLKAKSLYNMGRCLRMLANSQSASAPTQWDIQYMNLTAGSGVSGTHPVKPADEGTADDEMNEGKDLDLSSSQQIKYSTAAAKIKAKQSSSELYLCQATEVLAQCVQLALQKGDRSLVAAGCLELVESCGQFDNAMTSHYLALYQSCISAKCLEDLLLRSQRDPSTSKQAALLQQRQRLEADAMTTNRSFGTLFKVVSENLQETSEGWKRLAISPQHLDLIKELPPNFNLIILQHSEDKSTLYGSILDRPKASSGKEGGKPSKGSQPQTSRAKVTRTLVDPNTLESLHRRFRQHKHDVMATLLKAEYQRSQQTQRQKMLENISDDMKEGIKDWSGDIEKAEQKLQEQFLELLRELEEYLRPITSFLDPAIRALENPGPVPTSRSDPSAAANPEECVVILADKWLLEMPLEALAIFSSPAVTSLSRDFSLQMIYNRIHREPEEEMTDEKRKKEAAKIKAAKEKTKGIKMVPIDRPVPAGCLPIDTHSFKYVVDPHFDCPEEEATHPIYEMQEALKLYNNQFTARWEGIQGSDHVPSVGEWEEQFRECQAFISYGLERFFSHVPPQKMAPTNLSECLLVVLLDLVQTNRSFMRQSKIDTQKSSNELSLEKSVETAMLLSLSGAGCVLANQWHCTLQQNANKFQTLMKALLETGRTTGQTVRRMFIPTWGMEGEEEEGGEGEADDRIDGKTSVASQKASSGEGKGDKAKNLKVKGDEGGKSAKGKSEDGKSPKVRGKKDEKVAESPVKGQGSVTRLTSKERLGGGDDLELISRHWFNFVCYGLPNLLVTQV
ncbi:cilia- and flagella-associated protein 46-like isoform X3 [Asterias amurensis]|uniref:cilia- and flagella-associated protein 46-like isoform X3 n=1 Tax=Asterias amurensis TaxID=7602 RepID=UPI003AB22074